LSERCGDKVVGTGQLMLSNKKTENKLYDWGEFKKIVDEE